mmetsp:Transcript_26261/g.25438  ORF Transcript_26261/g.25438 Transcript_26261/m.25438 type:complete len:132 (+) Transcript_26261:1151-1546(+)
MQYKKTLPEIIFLGPTFFNPFLQALLQYCKTTLHIQMYHVILIMTDGDIHDKDLTTETIIELSKYPVSIIIVGVGDEEFEIMKFFDSDDALLRSQTGRVAERDIVQFVKYLDYAKADASLLAEEVLKELPD